MRLVERAVTFPSRCAAIPFVGGSHPDGYIDTGGELPATANKDSHVYVSVVAVRDMARLIGWAPPGEVEDLHAQIAVLKAEKATLEEEAAGADAFLEALDVLESKGFRARKKPGRPRKVEEEAVA